MEKKKKIDLKVILVSILLVLTLIPLINEFLAFGNPAKYNPRIDYLEPEMQSMLIYILGRI